MRTSLLLAGLMVLLVGTTLSCGGGMSGPDGECDPAPTEPPTMPRLLGAARITADMAVIRWEAGFNTAALPKPAVGATRLSCVAHETVYEVYRATTPTAPMFELICPSLFPCTLAVPYTDAGPFEIVDVLPSTTDTYYYYVVARNNAGTSAPTTMLQVDPLGP